MTLKEREIENIRKNQIDRMTVKKEEIRFLSEKEVEQFKQKQNNTFSDNYGCKYCSEKQN